MMAHVEEEVGCHSARSVHYFHEKPFIDFEKGYLEVVAYVVYRCELQRKDSNKVSLGNGTWDGTYLYYCVSASTYAGETFVQIGGFVSHWQMRKVSINIEIVEIFFC